MRENEAFAGTTTAKAKEYKVVTLRECPLPETPHLCDTPEKPLEYWNLSVANCPYFNPECECFATILLNTRQRVKGHQTISIGTLEAWLDHLKRRSPYA